MARYKDIEKDQGYFVTVYPSEHFDGNSVEKVIDQFVDEHVDTALFSEKYKNDYVGQKAIHPKVKLKVILYSLANGVQSSRKIENFIRMNHTGYLFLSKNRIIDHSTLCTFINDFADIIHEIFARLLFVMNELEMVDWSKIMIDGTKISSSASKEMTSDLKGFKKKLERYEKLSKKLIERAQYINKLEDRGELNPAEVDTEKKRMERQRKKYNSVIEKIKKYEKDIESKELDPKEKVNLTDRESKLLKDKNNYIQGYNIQAAYSNNDVIVEIEATDSCNDLSLLEKMVRRVEERKKNNNIKEKSDYLNDKGYFNPMQMKSLIEDGIEIYVALPEAFEQSWLISGEHKVEKREGEIYFICSAGREKKGKYSETEGKYRFEVTRKFCEGCSNTDKCWKGVKKDGKRKKFTVVKTYVDDKKMWNDYKRKMKSLDGRMIYNKRIGKEHNFHDLKYHNGLGIIKRRGKDRCNTMAVLAGIAHNIKKMQRFLIKNENSNDIVSKMIMQI